MTNRVDLTGISKSFGGNAALKNVTFRVLQGEIHALVGENGAGKSTLMKVLSGACLKDSGQIFIDGQEVQIKNTHDSKKLGIAIIYQEFSLVPALSVAENIFLSKLNASGSWMKWNRMNKMADELIRSIGFNIDPSRTVEGLSIAQQQIVEIAKALSGNAKILILDEPSAVLGPQEIGKLFSTLLKLRNDGVSIIYISHHIDEIFRIADRITVLKDGCACGVLKTSETGKDSVISLMLGRSLDKMYPGHNTIPGTEALRVTGLCAGNRVFNVSLKINAGEIVGLAGLVGSGRTETARAIFASDRKTKGEIFISGRKINLKNPETAVKAGIGMIPEDRKQSGIILSLSLRENISLTNYKDISGAFHFIKSKKERENSLGIVNRLKIKAGNVDQEAGSLSGGNQQKVVLGKWLNRNCRIFLIDEPTRGIDVGAKVEIYNLLSELTRKGAAVLVISSETSELIGICDRILVMRNGMIAGNLSKSQFSEENILRLALGEPATFMSEE